MGTVTGLRTGRIRRVNGPLVEVEGLPGVAMSEVVQLGPLRLPGEVVAVRGTLATVQAFEYTGGLAPGAEVVAVGRPLSVRLGPGLLGGVFDGLLRPLSGGPVWLEPGAELAGAVAAWPFRPALAAGRRVDAGDRVGTVTASGPLPHHVLVPPGLAGTVEWVAPAGDYGPDEPVARVGGEEVRLSAYWPVRRPRPVAERLDADAPLITGQRVLDVLFPIARGSSAAVPGGFGTGKTMLLQQVAKWCDADVIVYVGCGERGNELAEVVAELSALDDPRNGGRLADRTVIVANTSNMPMMAREVSIYTGATVAEYYRDMGYHAVVIADSTSRWAEALREFTSRTGALPAEEGYPADLASALAAFYERAGQARLLGGGAGSVTILGAVSPPGGDMTEPVTSQTERFVRCRWSLDRDLAYARHYPAVSWAGSFSRDADQLGAWYAANGDQDWSRRRARLGGVLAEADRLSALAELVGATALPDGQRIALLVGRLAREAVLQQSGINPNDAFCTPEKSAALVQALLAVADRCGQLAAAGTPAGVLEDLDYSALLRAAADTPPDGAGEVREHAEAVLTGLAALP